MKQFQNKNSVVFYCLFSLQLKYQHFHTANVQSFDEAKMHFSNDLFETYISRGLTLQIGFLQNTHTII